MCACMFARHWMRRPILLAERTGPAIVNRTLQKLHFASNRITVDDIPPGHKCIDCCMSFKIKKDSNGNATTTSLINSFGVYRVSAKHKYSDTRNFFFLLNTHMSGGFLTRNTFLVAPAPSFHETALIHMSRF